MNEAPASISPRGRTGRPSKLTRELIEKMRQVIVRGGYIESAAAHVGISRAVMYKWQRKGNEQKRGIYRDFLDMIDEALCEADERDLAIITAATEAHDATRIQRQTSGRTDKKGRPAPGSKVVETVTKERIAPDVRAAMWKLERRNPERFAPALRMLHMWERNLDATLAKLRERLPDAVFRQVVAALRDVAREEGDSRSLSAGTAAGVDPGEPGSDGEGAQ